VSSVQIAKSVILRLPQPWCCFNSIVRCRNPWKRSKEAIEAGEEPPDWYLTTKEKIAAKQKELHQKKKGVSPGRGGGGGGAGGGIPDYVGEPNVLPNGRSKKGGKGHTSATPKDADSKSEGDDWGSAATVVAESIPDYEDTSPRLVASGRERDDVVGGDKLQMLHALPKRTASRLGRFVKPESPEDLIRVNDAPTKPPSFEEDEEAEDESVEDDVSAVPPAKLLFGVPVVPKPHDIVEYVKPIAENVRPKVDLVKIHASDLRDTRTIPQAPNQASELLQEPQPAAPRIPKDRWPLRHPKNPNPAVVEPLLTLTRAPAPPSVLSTDDYLGSSHNNPSTPMPVLGATSLAVDAEKDADTGARGSDDRSQRELDGDEASRPSKESIAAVPPEHTSKHHAGDHHIDPLDSQHHPAPDHQFDPLQTQYHPAPGLKVKQDLISRFLTFLL
jgi:hypothetical protein